MFQVHGIQGRVFSGTLEQLRQQHLVTGVARVRRIAPVVTADLAARLAHETGAAPTLLHVLPGGALPRLRQWLGAGNAMELQLHDDARRQLGVLDSERQTHRHVTARPLLVVLHLAGLEAVMIDRYRQQASTDATLGVQAPAAASAQKPGDCEPCIVEGNASQRIVEHERKKDCDLVVLGKHGQSANEDLLLGSASKHVLAEGSANVLVSTAREA